VTRSPRRAATSNYSRIRFKKRKSIFPSIRIEGNSDAGRPFYAQKRAIIIEKMASKILENPTDLLKQGNKTDQIEELDDLGDGVEGQVGVFEYKSLQGVQLRLVLDIFEKSYSTIVECSINAEMSKWAYTVWSFLKCFIFRIENEMIIIWRLEGQ
jgi:hypothetical protein